MNALAPEADWVARLADEVIAESQRRAPGKPVVCASGLSPSGPIHLGNLREVMIPHLVADEIRRRGIESDHLISWDDYDRFRKVPAGIDPSWAQHIGKPLTAVPAPPGSPHASWADHFRAELVDALAELGIEFRGVSQTAQYTSGAYREQILFAMRERAHIDAVLARYRTLPGQPTGRGAPAPKAQKLDEQEAAAAAEAVEGSGAASEDDGSASAAGYYPYKPYCTVCGTDFTTVTAYDDDTTALTYDCRCGHSETVLLSEFNGGKLVWKVDWPMRWTYEGVIFEPSGVDHQSPGSSWVVGGQLVKEVFGGTQADRPDVRVRRHQGHGQDEQLARRGPHPGRRAGDHGAGPGPLALRAPQAGPVLQRRLRRRGAPHVRRVGLALPQGRRRYGAGRGPGGARPRHVHRGGRRCRPRRGRCPTARWRRWWTSPPAHDEQTLRILSDLDPERPVGSLDELRPRLTCAQRWVETQMPAQERTHVRTEPDRELLESLDEPGARVAAAARRGAGRPAGPWTGSPPWSTPCRRSRPACRRRPRPRRRSSRPPSASSSCCSTGC